MAARYAEKLHIVPLLAPAATTTAVKSYAVALKNAHWVSFLVTWGAMTSDDNNMVITVDATTNVGATTTNDTAIPFVYRLSGAVGTDDNWGDPTTCAETGLSIVGTGDNAALLIEVDPATVQALDSDATGVRVSINGVDNATNYAVGVVGLIEDRYPQAEHISAST